MDLTDEELRTKLSKYMTSVPPVTATTRVLLFNKLQKFLEADLNGVDESNEPPVIMDSPRKRTTGFVSSRITPSKESTTVQETSVSVNLTSSGGSERPASPKKAELTTGGAKGDTLSPSNSLNSSLFETANYRVRRFPATEMPEYPGGIPVFRRRSLHPSANELPDPYEEIVIRSPKLQAQIDAQRIMSKAMERAFGHASLKKTSRSRFQGLVSLYSACSGAIASFLSLILLPFSLAFKILGRLSTPNLRCVLLVFLICIVSGLALIFFYSDPFYHNPVTDFAAQISNSISAK
uniref:LEM domain n=2 Tax=Schistocephalus solidus TaxID=70667 RepID=A0A0X3PNH3_SCHSO